MLFRKRMGTTLEGFLQLKRRTEHKHHPSEPKKRSRPGFFRIVTYNIHKCRGLDRRVRPDRIAEVLAEIDADIIALQEVWNMEDGSTEDNQGRFIAGRLGMDYRFGENRRLNGGGYGNVILTRFPFISNENYDLSHHGCEERGCLRTDIAVNGVVLHVYNVHLGTAFHERRYQGKRLVESQILTGEDVTGPRILLGDFNEWRRGLASRLLTTHFKSLDVRAYLRRRRTYPAPLPLIHLDHIYFDDLLELQHTTLHRSRRAIVASDHLPLVADFEVRTGEAGYRISDIGYRKA